MKGLQWILMVILGVISLPSMAQTDWLKFPARDSSVKANVIYNHPILNYNTPKKGKVTIHKTEALDEVTEFISKDKNSIEGNKIDGFRVQIFFAESKTEAQSKKAQFLTMYPDVKAYIDYLAPNYRVRVGNFRTRLQAEKIKYDLLSYFPTCVVISDKIELPQLKSVEPTNP